MQLFIKFLCFVHFVGAGVAAKIKYFGYGSNMNIKVLNDRIFGDAIHLHRGILQNHVLTFNVPGIPMIEPSFASIAPSTGNEVHGLVVSMDERSFFTLCASEGVPLAYSLRIVDVTTYETNEKIQAFTLQGTRKSPSVAPSKRYLDILR